MNPWFLIVCIACALFMAGCGGDEQESTKTPPSSPDFDMSTPRGSVGHQLGLLKAKDVEKLKACFTERAKGMVAADDVAKASEELASTTLDDLFASAAEGEYEGKKTAKVKMKNGRTLTTLVLVDGAWLSDTIWYK